MEKKKNKLEYKPTHIAYVEWRDAWSDEEAYEKDEILAEVKSYPKRSCGFLMKQVTTGNDQGILLAHEFNPEDETSEGLLWIPRAWICWVRRMKIPEKRKKG